MPAALLIHGFCSDRHDFERLVPLLSTRYQKVYSPDLPSHGARLKQEKMNSKQILDFVTEAFDELYAEYGVVDVFGFSMGGAITCYLASIRPVNRIVLLAPAIKYLSPTFPFMRLRYMAVRSKVKAGEMNEIFRDCECICTKEELKQDKRTVTRFLFKMLLPNYSLRRIAHFNKIIKQCNKALKPIKIPTLILWGKFDQLVPPSCIEHILGFCRHQHTRTIVYADISHIMLYSAAYPRIIDDILRFLEDDNPPAIGYKD